MVLFSNAILSFTSVAFAHTASPDAVKLVDTWPNSSAGNNSAKQVPSELHYINPRTRENCWGYAIPSKGASAPAPLQWFKLLLQEKATPAMRQQPAVPFRRVSNANRRGRMTLEGFLGDMSLSGPSQTAGPSDSFTPPANTPAQSTAKKLQELGLTPVAVISDFLSAIRETTVASIEGTYPADLVRETKVEYVLTVPAMWSDSAKSHMVRAAEAAGFGTHRVDFDLVSEPEAAASYTLKVMQPHNLNVS